MSRFKVQKLNVDEVKGNMDHLVDDLSDDDYDGANCDPLELVTFPADEMFYRGLHHIPSAYPIPYEATMAGQVTFDPTPPVYSYSEWCSTEGEEAVHFRVFNRQQKFEPGRTFPASWDCFNVYQKFLCEKALAGPKYPKITVCPKFAHLQFQYFPRQKSFPCSRTVYVKNLRKNRAWICDPVMSFYSKYETCCTERCIVVVQRIGEPIHQNYEPLKATCNVL